MDGAEDEIQKRIAEALAKERARVAAEEASRRRREAEEEERRRVETEEREHQLMMARLASHKGAANVMKGVLFRMQVLAGGLLFCVCRGLERTTMGAGAVCNVMCTYACPPLLSCP